MIAGYGPVALEAQYYYLQVNRKKDFKNYKASGMYGILRGLLIGGNYRYSHTDCGIATRTLVRWNAYSDITILICRIPGPIFMAGV